MASRETPKDTSKGQRPTIKAMIQRIKSPVSATKKTIASKKFVEKVVKENNWATSLRSRTSTVPKVASPNSEEKKPEELVRGGSIRKSVTNRKSMPAHSENNCATSLRSRTGTIPKVASPNTEEEKAEALVRGGSIRKSVTNRKSMPAHSENNCATSLRSRTSTVPKVASPNSEEKEPEELVRGGSIRKSVTNRKSMPAHSENNCATSLRSRTSTVPKVASPNSEEKEPEELVRGGSIRKSVTNRKSMPAHSENNCATSLRSRTSTVPKVASPNSEEKEPEELVRGGSIRKSVTNRKSMPAHSENNCATSLRSRTSTVPKVASSNSEEKKPEQLVRGGSIRRSVKNRKSLPAHSGVPVPEKLKKAMEKEKQNPDPECICC